MGGARFSLALFLTQVHNGSRLQREATKQDMLSRPPRQVWDHLALTMQVGLTFAGSLLFCLAVGIGLDRWLGTSGVFTTIFILLGIAGGGYTAYRQIMKLLKPDGEDSDSYGP